ncbi:PssE/Cps14G family polysaccharide biosynthesis glycosyltransferase [Vibrio furnissii]|uniref:PssE/Cps14G family polysaccharide biosynthesis glycosyltransferase n=1 Tax=Vibrio furnissii TaxID=29494 RepID=UPI0037526739
MKILVTVGTTQFDGLIDRVSKTIDNRMNVIYQVSNYSKYINEGDNYFSFSDEFGLLVDSADLIITHAGAGSVYDYLEKKKKLIVVPNLDRADKHQIELSNYVRKNNFALVGCSHTSNFSQLVEECLVTEFNSYNKIDFFYTDNLYRMLS